MDLSLQAFWIPLLKIIWINIVLSEQRGGDRSGALLPPRQQMMAVGIVLTLFAVALLQLPT
jgi:hypothetical protein